MLDFVLASEQEIRLELRERLKGQRLSQGLTQATLAERAGIGVQTLKAFELHGKCNLETFLRVVMALGLTKELQALFVNKPVSIAQLAEIEAPRKRAPRASSRRKAK